jgi:hypothetical protein
MRALGIGKPAVLRTEGEMDFGGLDTPTWLASATSVDHHIMMILIVICT